MARQTEGINGGFVGRVGTVVGYQWRGKWCMRSYPQHIHDRKSEAQLRQRGWFAEAVRFASRLTEVLRVGLREASTAMHMTEGNLFVRLNKGLFSMEEGRLEVDYAQLTLSLGNVATVGFGVPRKEGGAGERRVAVDFDRNPLHADCEGGDKVYLVAIDAASQHAMLGLPTYRRHGSVAIEFPQGWEGREVHLYGMVQNYEGATSPSEYLGSVRLEDDHDGTVSQTEDGDDGSRGLLDGGGDAGREGGEFVGRHLDMVAEVEVAGLVERQKVDVDVGHVDAHHGLANLDAGADLLEAFGHAPREEV